MLRNPIVVLALFTCACVLGEGQQAPPLDLASPIGLPSAGVRPHGENERSDFCKQHPCDPRCDQVVSCNDYDAKADVCSKKDQILVDWRCEEPCSCAEDGSVMCSVTYRCVDMTAELGELTNGTKIKVEVPVQFSRYGNRPTKPEE